MKELDNADRALAASMKRQGRSFVDAAGEPAHRTEPVGTSVTLFCAWWLVLVSWCHYVGVFHVNGVIWMLSSLFGSQLLQIPFTGSVAMLMKCCPA